MIKLFFDIETIPCPDELRSSAITALKKRSNNSKKTDEELFTETSFEGTFGRICSVGIIKDNDTKILQKAVFSGTEEEILQNFWDMAVGVERFIGHNIWSFDLPFIYKRSIIKGIRPRYLNMARYRNIPIYDTMQEWELWNFGTKVKLDTLAKVLDLPTSKDDMDGSMVWPYYQEGRFDEIDKYCMKDVELTRQVYYKMTFEKLHEGGDIDG